MQQFSIVSYNVNGIRAAFNKGFVEWLKAGNYDIVCLQEIKATPDQIPTLDIELAGYPYHYWFPAQKKGYSGVAVLSKIEPKNVVFGTGLDYMDFEGRNLRLDFEDFSVMSLYLPSGTNIDRLDHKFKYMDDFQVYINDLKKEIPNFFYGNMYCNYAKCLSVDKEFDKAEIIYKKVLDEHPFKNTLLKFDFTIGQF